MRSVLVAAWLVAAPAFSQNAPWDVARDVAGKAATGKLEKSINQRLLSEARKNQCSFKTDSDQFAKGCNSQLKNLANALIDAKKKLNDAKVSNFKFEVSGHTDSTGNEGHNKVLSEKRAQVIVNELVKRGVPKDQIVAVGKGSSERMVKPDDTPAKKAKNRRYELRVRL